MTLKKEAESKYAVDDGLSTHSDPPSYAEFYDPSKESVWTRLGLTFESFKRAPGTTGGLAISGSGVDEEKLRAENPMLQQQMKPRHLTMIAVGGSIGTGLFVGSGAALNAGGPAGLLIAWIIMGIMLINVTQALGELCIMYPVSGGFYTLASRFLDPSFAFAMGWNYWLQWAITLPLEISVAGVTVQYWTEKVPIAAWITIFWLLIIFICVFGTLGYAEEEFWSACLKLLVIIMFAFVGVVCICGGGPKDGEYGHYIGGAMWRDPGAFANGFKGVCAVFVTAAFAFSGTELVGFAAAETPDPRSSMPAAVKGTFWRVTLIYIVSLTIIGLLVPFNEPRLLGGSGSAASPFVIALANARIPGLDHFVNATICVSVISIGMASVYGGSRALTGLAETGYAPKIFSYVDKSSRPLWSVVFTLAFGALGYINIVTSGDTICEPYPRNMENTFSIRFRKAWVTQGHSIEELPFQALGGVYGSYLGVLILSLVLVAQFYIAIWPIGGMSSNGGEVAENFFMAYLAVPITVITWIGGYLWKKGLPKKASEIDLDTGRKSWLTVEEMREYRAQRRAAPFYIRTYRFFFSN
ncbi:hypothetical protein H0H92_012468 [Tricholoma furcatifolium]|nr:hypothetical protein H0H92_012468 [Tricholoma furcatifolium]